MTTAPESGPRTAVSAVGHDATWPTDNMFLNGPYTPWTAEEAAYDLVVEGQIPADLAGALFRSSPNPRFEPRNTDRYHWFDGDGMVTGIYIRDGKVAYRTRWAENPSMHVELKAGEAIYAGFVNGGSTGRVPDGAPPRRSVHNTNVGIFADHLIVYYEGDLPIRMHPRTLEPQGYHDFHGALDLVCTAHYKIDPTTGDMLFYAAMGPKVTWYRADVATGKVIDSHSFDIGLPVMMHDFAVSENYAIFFVTPALARIDLAIQGRPSLVWDEKALPDGVQIVLMDRRTHEVTRHDMGGMFANTHFGNAYELGDQLIIDGHRITRLGTPMDRVDDPVRPHEWFPPALPYRWRIDLTTGRAREEMVSGIAGEFPKINDAFVGQQHRYGYFVTTRGLAADTMADGLAKHDLLLDSTTVIEGPGALTSPSEPVFVARENPTGEDDGYLLSIWWNRQTGLSELLIYNAADWSAKPLARVKLPSRIPYGFHGSWADAAALDRAIAAQGDTA
jgi:carotenoid cleavage dioxygenase-like enzyme